MAACSGPVAQVRRFQRLVTAAVGALGDDHLGRGRPLGASRVLHEIGAGGSEVRALRMRLGLDSGYLSRLLRSLEQEGLVTTKPSPADQRVRRAVLTKAGHEEWATLDRLSDEAAVRLLDSLDEGRRSSLVAAMAEVERLLTAATVDIAPADPMSEDARWCLAEYYRELDERFEQGFDLALAAATDAPDLVPPRGLMMIARIGDMPVGCGVLKVTGAHVVDVKRMWVAPAARGLGLGRRMLDALEQRAADDLDAREVRLETNRALVEALAMYRAAGYTEVAPFNDERYGHHWFVKAV